MRDRHLIVKDIVQSLGGPERVAGILSVEKGTVDKYMGAADASGRDLPLERAIALIGNAGARRHDAALQDLVDEYLAHFALPAGRKIVRLSALREIEEAILSLKNGKAHNSIIERCPDCDRSLKVVGKDNGFFVYRCDHCHGRGRAA